MIKKTVLLATFLFYFLVSLQSVQALEIDVSDGVVSIYRDSVLGDSDRDFENKRFKERKTEKKPKRERIFKSSRQNIRVQKHGERTQIELRPAVRRSEKKTDLITKNKLERINQLETDRLEMRFRPDIKLDADKRKRELKKDGREKIRAIKNERAERKKKVDLVKLESNDVRGKHRLEIEAKRIKAHLSEGTQFELNSDTNEVTLITPSGEQKILNHLPDQAIERMKAAGVLQSTVTPTDQMAVEVNSQTRQIEYRQKVQRTKRFLGLFKRDIATEVVLNDATGEVHEEPQATGFARLLNALSF